MHVLYIVKITLGLELVSCVADSVFLKWTHDFPQQGLTFHSPCTKPNPVTALMTRLWHK